MRLFPFLKKKLLCFCRLKINQIFKCKIVYTLGNRTVLIYKELGAKKNEGLFYHFLFYKLPPVEEVFAHYLYFSLYMK